MKVPKKIKRYCPYCKTHVVMTVRSSKRRDRSSLKRGSKQRAMARGLNRGSGNQGRYSKGALSSWKRYNKKQSKKTDLRFTCPNCGKTIAQSEGKRAKRIEFI